MCAQHGVKDKVPTLKVGIPSCLPIGLKLEKPVALHLPKLAKPSGTPSRRVRKSMDWESRFPNSRCISLRVLIRNPNNREQIMVLDDVHATARNCSLLIPAYMHQNPNSKSHTTLDRFPPSSNSNQRATSLQDKFLLLHSAQKTLRFATDYAFPHSI